MEVILSGVALLVLSLFVREVHKGLKNKQVATPQQLHTGNGRRATFAKLGLASRRKPQKVLVLEKPDLMPTPEGDHALHLLERTRQHIFLTGKAGTGKSTLLKYFRATTKKSIAVLAPTGIAALNVEGQTIHRFFGFKPDITINTVKRYLPFERRILYKRLQVLVIDEISMVRADLVDCIDAFLQIHGPMPGRPFGGVQLVFIGDLYQLPPVVKSDEEHIFETYYNSQFFFSAKALQGLEFIPIELTRVFRQSDAEFIEALNAVREGEMSDKHLELLNSRVQEHLEHGVIGSEMRIHLMPKRGQVAEVNARCMDTLPGQGRVYAGRIEGEFSHDQLPTDIELLLKEGAQVMLLNNHPEGKWVNGDVAKVVGLGNEGVRLLFDDGTYDDVGSYTWDAYKYVLEETQGKIVAVTEGSFTQLPLKPAWALTVHKSQGKTFDDVVIDFSEGVFHSGQAYVALSRCRTLKGLALKVPLKEKHIIINPLVKEFMALASIRSQQVVPRS